MLNRELILQADDLTRELVHIPAWGGDVYVRVMTGAEKDWWESSMMTDDGEALPAMDRIRNMRARMAVVTVCDEQGVSLFHLADVELLTKKSAVALDQIWDVARRLNQITKEEEETLLKNSDSGQSDDSG